MDLGVREIVNNGKNVIIIPIGLNIFQLLIKHHRGYKAYPGSLPCQTEKAACAQTARKGFCALPAHLYIKSAVIGAIIGIVPGAGGNIAGYVAYNEAKRASKTPGEFGKGCREGVAATETANNAVCGGSLIPMLTLGIPGNSVAAVLMGGLMIQGLTPGFSLFDKSAHIVYPFLIGFLLAQFAFTIIGLLGAKQFAKVVKIPKGYLLAAIGVLCVVGSYAASNNIFDVYVMLACGVIGYFLKTAGFDISAIVLGLMLGSLAEAGFVQAFTLNKQVMSATLLSFVTKPISLLLLVLCVVSCFTPLLNAKKKKASGR